MDSIWNQERETLVSDMWSRGSSGSSIAAELNCFPDARDGGRSAVLSKVRRMGLEFREPKMSFRTPRQRRNKLTQMMLETVPAEPVQVYRDASPVPPLNIPFLQVTEGQCREIVGRGEALVLFCGHPSEGSYCPYHHQKNYTRRLSDAA